LRTEEDSPNTPIFEPKECPYMHLCEDYRIMEGDSPKYTDSRGRTIKVIDDRCHHHAGRCMRYWQFKKRDEEARAEFRKAKEKHEREKGREVGTGTQADKQA